MELAAALQDADGIALRMDDVGAASKAHEVYARSLPLPGRLSGAGNVLFLKYLPPFRAWGPYRELTAQEWERILEVLRARDAVLTVAVTAAWVERSGQLVPFPERFPRAASLIREGVRGGLLEVANHGLTHCVVESGAFRPRLFASNRTSHREFWDWVPADRQEQHLRRAQEILQSWLGINVVTFVPPGNVFGAATLVAARRAGLRIVSCASSPRRENGLVIVGNDRVVAFHDRDVVLGGIRWLRAAIDAAALGGRRFRFVRDLAEERAPATAD